MIIGGLVAAAVAVAIGAALQRDGTADAQAVAAAVARTRGAATASFEVTATTTIDFNEPVAVEPYVLPPMRRVRRDLDPDLPAAVRDSFLVARREMLELRAAGPSGAFPSVTRLSTVTTEIEGSGLVDFGGRSRLTGTVRTPLTSPAVPFGRSELELILVRPAVYARTPATGEGWIVAEHPPPTLTGAIGPANALDALAGDAQTVGVDMFDGEQVTHFRVPVAAVPDVPGGTHAVEVWIGVADGRVHRVRSVTEGTTGLDSYESIVDITYRDFGVDVAIAEPSRDDTATLKQLFGEEASETGLFGGLPR